MTDHAPEVVCDAGPLIHLGELECLDLLLDFPLVLVPGAVREEVRRHRRRVLDQIDVRLQFPEASPPPSTTLRALIRSLALDRGEQDALALAQDRTGCLLLTDDSAARLAAQALGVRVQGTIGVIVRAIRRGQRTRSEVLKVLRSLPRMSTLHVRGSLLNEVIAAVESAAE